MKAKPDEFDPLLFKVPSDAGKPDWTVDLGWYEGNGKCDCPHFRCKIEPDLVKGSEPSERTECKHIKAANTYALNEYKRRIIYHRRIQAGRQGIDPETQP